MDEELDEEYRRDIGDDWERDARRERSARYRECEHFGCAAEAGWQDDDTGAWFCPEHAL